MEKTNNSTSVTPKTYNSNTRKRSFYGQGKYKWEVYPDYWKDSWGMRPLLGTVYGNDSFYAEREAYNKGLLTVNFTFGPLVIKMEEPVEVPTRNK